MGVLCFDRKFSPFRHGVTGIDRKIDDSVLKLVRVGFDYPKARCEDGLDFNCLAKRPVKQLRHAWN
jgi:hypothetical protein